MISKEDIKHYALNLGFKAIGFTSAEKFDSQLNVLKERQNLYQEIGIGLIEGTDPKKIFPEARSIIVLVHPYYDSNFPSSLKNHFGKYYIHDDRVLRRDLFKRIQEFVKFLNGNGIKAVFSDKISHRMSAARAGLGSFGRNCLFFSETILGASWTTPNAFLVDHQFEPDIPSFEIGCPKWCKNACINSCPTGALKADKWSKIDPKRCISYLTYSLNDIMPLEFREPSGLWVYGCDQCQVVCPRNAPWQKKTNELPISEKSKQMEQDFELTQLLLMDDEYFNKKVWPNMFYMDSKKIWKWKENVARVMGNSLDPSYIHALIQAFNENENERIRGMIAWALGRIGGEKAKEFLEKLLNSEQKNVKEEIIQALKNLDLR